MKKKESFYSRGKRAKNANRTIAEETEMSRRWAQNDHDHQYSEVEINRQKHGSTQRWEGGGAQHVVEVRTWPWRGPSGSTPCTSEWTAYWSVRDRITGTQLVSDLRNGPMQVTLTSTQAKKPNSSRFQKPPSRLFRLPPQMSPRLSWQQTLFKPTVSPSLF